MSERDDRALAFMLGLSFGLLIWQLARLLAQSVRIRRTRPLELRDSSAGMLHSNLGLVPNQNAAFKYTLDGAAPAGASGADAEARSAGAEAQRSGDTTPRVTSVDTE